MSVPSRRDRIRGLLLTSFTSVLGAAALAAGIAAGTRGQSGAVIAFTRSFSVPRQLEIGLIGTDGHGLRRLRTGVVPSWEPEWSPDGRRILFRGGRTDDLYLVQPDGSRLRQLTRDRAHEQSPAWSPDEAEVAYTRYTSPTASSSIWVLRLKTGATRPLTRGTLGAGQPSWSPDGRQIAFVSQIPQHGYEPQLWLMDADGSNQHPIFPNLTGASDPVWSPDGHRMLITDGDSIYVLDAKHGHPHRIVTLQASAAGEKTEPSPEWSPDGTKVIFDQLDLNGNPEIWIANVNGNHLQRVTRAADGALRATDPSWRPIRR